MAAVLHRFSWKDVPGFSDNDKEYKRARAMSLLDYIGTGACQIHVLPVALKQRASLFT